MVSEDRPNIEILRIQIEKLLIANERLHAENDELRSFLDILANMNLRGLAACPFCHEPRQDVQLGPVMSTVYRHPADCAISRALKWEREHPKE